VFITWGVGFLGLAAWSIHKEYKARHQKTQETEAPENGGGNLDEVGDTQEVTQAPKELPG
jgi:hypothetical protein